ncbi:MAG TPA: manganese ABC transporter ATP-binding protein, partial [Planctomycetaceae bacterium]|nr:manganese ABC transporter ATP-binding protein [Planctomycetaceae bacterium]
MTVENQPILTLQSVRKSYRGRAALQGISLQLYPGELLGFFGPNGAGKSTLIKAIMGLMPLESGWVQIYGQPLARQRRAVGYVPQRESVDWDFPVTVRDVVLMGTYGRLGLFRRPGAAERELCDKCLEQVGMAAYADRQIANLSGGQRQRVFLARALVQRADLLLLDEPT